MSVAALQRRKTTHFHDVKKLTQKFYPHISLKSFKTAVAKTKYQMRQVVDFTPPAVLREISDFIIKSGAADAQENW
ncbi:hypothetical protein EST38_g2283 [Candolleomyces aberdarensis]|uniref:Uncharacterized protein n=1 Tax=Candolleomyces aberdarensis TaxID=2316362 RepID=A0A4Q2DV08_9AGAR|nr:hypothetical protein EST38_g2283 [Candolleomyces aberdarensis]